jgi:predicted small integral membrane protein
LIEACIAKDRGGGIAGTVPFVVTVGFMIIGGSGFGCGIPLVEWPGGCLLFYRTILAVLILVNQKDDDLEIGRR